MATTSEAKTLPSKMDHVLSIDDQNDKIKTGMVGTDEEKTKSEGSILATSVLEAHGEYPHYSHSIKPLDGMAENCFLTCVEGQYSEDQYKWLKRKVDRYLLPLMWLCYGIQQTDKYVALVPAYEPSDR